MARAVVLPPGFHLCIDGPGQDLLMIISAVKEGLGKLQNSVQHDYFTVLHNATGVGQRKPRVAGWGVGSGGGEGARKQYAQNRENVKAEVWEMSKGGLKSAVFENWDWGLEWYWACWGNGPTLSGP